MRHVLHLTTKLGEPIDIVALEIAAVEEETETTPTIVTLAGGLKDYEVLETRSDIVEQVEKVLQQQHNIDTSYRQP